MRCRHFLPASKCAVPAFFPVSKGAVPVFLPASRDAVPAFVGPNGFLAVIFVCVALLLGLSMVFSELRECYDSMSVSLHASLQDEL